jgi:micrococcal nuclease
MDGSCASLSQILMIWLPTSQEPKHTGLWAKIPSCYDGDTCHSQGLRYGNQLLPDLFSTLNIRILGIDSPELRTAECELEYCLAVQAKLELERILGAGDDKLVSLVNCRHDKYGGRITCDILAGDGRSAASAMLETGLAVPYHGKRKTHSWCDVSRMDDRLYRHAVNCGWEMGETEAERDDDSYEDEDGSF